MSVFPYHSIRSCDAHIKPNEFAHEMKLNQNSNGSILKTEHIYYLLFTHFFVAFSWFSCKHHKILRQCNTYMIICMYCGCVRVYVCVSNENLIAENKINVQLLCFSAVPIHKIANNNNKKKRPTNKNRIQ